jgi:hypothetical protein
MTDSSTRRFDDDEVRRILERASELHVERPEPRSVSGGLTGQELEEIAEEVGIERALVRRAIRELDVPAPPSGTAALFLGAPATIRIDEVVPGEVGTRGFEAMQIDIDGAAQTPGQGSLVGRSLRWQSGAYAQNRWLRVEVTSGDGETRILIHERLHNLAGGLFGGIMGGVGGGVGFGVGFGVGLGALGSPAFAVAFASGTILASYLLSRGIFRMIGRNRLEVLTRLAGELAAYPEANAADE